MSRKPANPVVSGTGAPGHVRIIGGRLRGSKLEVAQRDGLRPTADRVRETLFNWLQPVLPGARCLDLFAGSGALGIEACSRGAAEVVMIERDAQLAAALRASVTRLKLDNARVIAADALHWLEADPNAANQRSSELITEKQGYDIVFVDPPFAAGIWEQAVAALSRWMSADAWLYLETARDTSGSPSGWSMHRQGQTRDVSYSLWRRIS